MAESPIPDVRYGGFCHGDYFYPRFLLKASRYSPGVMCSNFL